MLFIGLMKSKNSKDSSNIKIILVGHHLQIGKKNFGVRQIFTTVDKVNMLIDKSEGTNRVPSLYSRKQTPELPSWIMYDKQVGFT